MTSQDIKQAKKELEKAQRLLTEFIREGKNTSRLLSDIKYLKAIIGPQRGGEENMTDVNVSDESKAEETVTKSDEVKVDKITLKVGEKVYSKDKLALSSVADELKILRRASALLKKALPDVLSGGKVEMWFN